MNYFSKQVNECTSKQVNECTSTSTFVLSFNRQSRASKCPDHPVEYRQF